MRVAVTSTGGWLKQMSKFWSLMEGMIRGGSAGMEVSIGFASVFNIKVGFELRQVRWLGVSIILWGGKFLFFFVTANPLSLKTTPPPLPSQKPTPSDTTSGCVAFLNMLFGHTQHHHKKLRFYTHGNSYHKDIRKYLDKNPTNSSNFRATLALFTFA